MENILIAISKSVAVAAYVHDHEALRILSGTDGISIQKYEQINLQPFIDCGLLIVVTPESDAENTTFVNFATALDDGEAITGAMAVHRNWAIASDDRKAASFFNQHVPHLQVISTPELIKHWVDTASPSLEKIRLALQKIRVKARYEPPLRHKLYLWWQKHKNGDNL